jgi:capsular polysaccharide export protein
LEQLLSSDADVLAPDAALVRQAREKLLSAGLSKYNHAPDLPAGVLRAMMFSGCWWWTRRLGI